MYIDKAIKKALKKQAYIIRADKIYACFKPTDTSDCIILCTRDGREHPRWSPQIDDILSNRWKVIKSNPFRGDNNENN